METKESFVARNTQFWAYLALFVVVSLMNVYGAIVHHFQPSLHFTWAVVCFVAILYIAPISQWKIVVAAIVLSHAFWLALLQPNHVDWPMAAIEVGTSLLIAFYAKYFNNNWQPSDFNSKMLAYLPAAAPSYLIYFMCVFLNDWEAYSLSWSSFEFTLDYFFQHAHFLEFSIATGLTFHILHWNSQGLKRPTQIPLFLLACLTHFTFLYVWPHNLLLLSITMVVWVYILGIEAIAIPSLLCALALPFIPYQSTTLLDHISQLSYGMAILLSGFLGLILKYFVESVENGEPYQVLISRMNPLSFLIRPLEVDTLKSQLQEKNQQIRQAYSDLEKSNIDLKALAESLEIQTQTYKKMAEVDQVTGLKSRHYFYNFLSDGVRERPFWLMLIDLDNFKSINDTYGHDAGDKMLLECGKVLEQAVMHKGFAARVGGEEFCVALYWVSVAEARTFADNLRRSLRRAFITKAGVNISRTASIGVAELRQHARLEDVISLADEALYASKSKGKDLTTLADTAFIIKSHNNQNNLTVEDLLAGIKAQEFQLYIQPICDNATGKATGFEGLMRWHRPDGSIVFPGRFLELAVSPAVYPKFLDFYTSQVIPIAIALAKKNPNYYFSFNTEATFIQSSQLVEKFISKLSGLPMLHGNLVLELPEKTAILNPKTALKNIMLLQENGIKIALDDFGMEHSNMDRIRDIPADIVKIDRSFISKIDQNPRSLAIVNALVSMAKQLDFLIIAEGIETQAQAITLAASGVSRAQGYYYGHPKPVDYWLEQIQIGHI